MNSRWLNLTADTRFKKLSTILSEAVWTADADLLYR